MNLSDILSKAAPWLAETADELAAAVQGASPEQMVGLRMAEMDFERRMKELGFQHAADLESIAAKDRDSARSMQVANKSFMPAVLSVLVTGGYLLILCGMLAGWLKTSDSQALLLLLGSLGTGWGMVLSFWFGSTRTSEDKTRLLAQAHPIKG
jgi:hypothetical protein